MPDWRSTQMMGLVCASIIVDAMPCRRVRRWTTCVLHTVSDSGSGHAHTEGFCAFRLVGTRRSFRTSGVQLWFDSFFQISGSVGPLTWRRSGELRRTEPQMLPVVLAADVARLLEAVPSLKFC